MDQNHITYEFGSYSIQAIKTFFVRSLRNRLILGFEITFVLLSFIILYHFFSPVLLFVTLLLIIKLVCMIVRAFVILPRKYKKDSKYQKLVTIRYDADGIELVSDEFSSKVLWQYFMKAWETEKLFYLFHDRRHFWIVPKDKFENEEQESIFRDLIRKHHKIQTGIYK